jgi:hypothetical protein
MFMASTFHKCRVIVWATRLTILTGSIVRSVVVIVHALIVAPSRR